MLISRAISRSYLQAVRQRQPLSAAKGLHAPRPNIKNRLKCPVHLAAPSRQPRAFHTSHPSSTSSEPETYPSNVTVLEPSDTSDEAERKIFYKLRDSLHPAALNVQDISGGCGSMYSLDVVSDKFRGLGVVKQHKMVNEILKEEVKGWHGVQIKTRTP